MLLVRVNALLPGYVAVGSIAILRSYLGYDEFAQFDLYSPVSALLSNSGGSSINVVDSFGVVKQSEVLDCGDPILIQGLLGGRDGGTMPRICDDIYILRIQVLKLRITAVYEKEWISPQERILQLEEPNVKEMLRIERFRVMGCEVLRLV
jgi:hypothetical protein